MKVTQVSNEYVRNNLFEEGLFRVMLCDDTHGNTGKRHFSARIKQTVPTIVPQIEPPIAPSTLLFGEILGISLCLPILQPIE